MEWRSWRGRFGGGMRDEKRKGKGKTEERLR
jgi:hypothetical protein